MPGLISPGAMVWGGAACPLANTIKERATTSKRNSMTCQSSMVRGCVILRAMPSLHFLKCPLFLLVLLVFAGCPDNPSDLKNVIGSYDVMVAQGGRMDPVVLSASDAGGVLSLSFTDGFLTPLDAAN